MQTEYDKHWDSLKNCWGNADLIGGYELYSYIISGKYATRFYWDWKNNYDENKQDSDNTAIRIACKAYANDKSEFDNRNIVIAFNYYDSIYRITVYVEYFGENPPETVIFNIDLIENEYVADRINAEELTGLTIEEIVETAEINRKGFEDLMYAMKEHELEESKKDLNSNLESSYAIATLLVVILLTLWITVLVAILKSMPSNKNRRALL